MENLQQMEAIDFDDLELMDAIATIDFEDPELIEAMESVQPEDADEAFAERLIPDYTSANKYVLNLSYLTQLSKKRLSYWYNRSREYIERNLNKICGKFYTDLEITGVGAGIKRMKYQCNDPRGCPMCRQRVIDEHKAHLFKLARCFAKEIDPKDQAKIIRKIRDKCNGKDDYKVFNLDNGKNLIILKSKAVLDSIKEDGFSRLARGNVAELAERTIPEKGRRMSGTLGDKVKPAVIKEDGEKEIQSRQAVVDAGKELQAKILTEAKDRVNALQPKTWQELADNFWNFVIELCAKYEVVVYHIRNTVVYYKENDISPQFDEAMWQRSMDKLLKSK